MGIGLAELIILKCEDEKGEKWEIVPPKDVPSKIKDDPEVMEYLVSGCQPQFPGETTIYAALKVGRPNPTTVGSAIKLIGEGMH